MEKIKICLWASSQEWNIGVNNYGTEEENMFRICDIVEGLLNKYGVFDIYRNETHWTLQHNVNQANTIRPDIIVEVHSNAGGGEGTEVYCNTKNDYGLELASYLYNHVKPISPGKDRGIKDGTMFFDIRKTIDTACLIELFFHDNKEEVEDFKGNETEYAVAIERAIVGFYKIPFREYLHEKPKTVVNELLILQDGVKVIHDKITKIIERM